MWSIGKNWKELSQTLQKNSYKKSQFKFNMNGMTNSLNVYISCGKNCCFSGEMLHTYWLIGPPRKGFWFTYLPCETGLSLNRRSVNDDKRPNALIELYYKWRKIIQLLKSKNCWKRMWQERPKLNFSKNISGNLISFRVVHACYIIASAT